MTREKLMARIDEMCQRPSPVLARILFAQNRMLNEMWAAEVYAPKSVILDGAYTDRAAAYPMFPKWMGRGAEPATIPAPATPRCECGADAAGCGGGGAHSDWCPLARRP